MTAKLAGGVSRLAWYIGPPSVLVLMGLTLFPSGGQDDAHITCWPAYTLSQFGQILNYNGDRVEQSSSLLQVIVLASLHKLTGLDLLTLAKLSSIAFGMASLLVLFTLVTRVTSRAAAFCAAIIAAASPPIVYWAFSGMESSLVSFAGICLVLAAADYMVGHPTGSLWKATLALCAFALVRPETPLLLGCMLVSASAVASVTGKSSDPRAAGPNPVRQRGLLLLLMFAMVCAALFAFRWIYFGDLFPQPVAAKFSGISVRNAVNGLYYLKGHAWNDGAATAIVTSTIILSGILTAVSQLRARTLNLYVVLSLLFAVGYLSFVIIAGGDWMTRGRFLVHFLPVAIALVPFALDGVNAKAWALPSIAAVLVALEVTSAVAFAKNGSTSVPLWASTAGGGDLGAQYSWFERRSRINVRDMPLIDNLDDMVGRISSRKQTPVVIISGQMGMVPYYIAMRHFRRVRFLDRHGLVDRAFTDCVTTRDVAKDTGGLVLPFDRYFENLAEMERKCQLPRPDVVFDIGSFFNARVATYGYREVYTQAGDLAVVGTRLVGGSVRADAFIGVDTRLLPSMGPVPARHVQFGR